MTRICTDKICLLRTSAIGDTVHALALVNAIRTGFPNSHLTWVLQTLPFEMVRQQPGIDRFIPFDRKGGLKEWHALSRRLRRERFDLLIVPQASLKVSLLTLLTRAQIKLGFDWHRSRDLLYLATNRHIPARPRKHVQDQFFEFAEFLGIQNYPVRWDFQFSDTERAWQQAFFAKSDRPVIGFVIASAHPEKDWAPPFYARVMDYVDKELHFQPMILGGPGGREKRIAGQIRSLCRCEPVIALEKPIRRTMLQLDACRLVVAPDTGPLHIAVALQTPTIGLYGYSNPRRCGPYQYRDLIIDKYNEDEAENAPITRRTKPGRMKWIQPEEVMEKIRKGLAAYPDEKALEMRSK